MNEFHIQPVVEAGKSLKQAFEKAQIISDAKLKLAHFSPELRDSILESYNQKVNECLGVDMTCADTTTTAASTRLTMEILDKKTINVDVIGLPEPKISSLNPESLNLKLERETDPFDAFRYVAMWGMPIIKPMRTITEQIQTRSHKKKRINKKWLKRYGTKEVSRQVEYTPFVLSGAGI